MSGFFRLAPENITPIWDQIEKLLTPALAQSGTHSAEDVRQMCMAQQAHLWAQMDIPVVEAVIVTEFVRYPRGLFLRAWLAAADRDAPLDDEIATDALEKWRVMHGCIGFEIIGRMGWLRRVPGMQFEGVVMRKVFSTTSIPMRGRVH